MARAAVVVGELGERGGGPAGLVDERAGVVGEGLVLGEGGILLLLRVVETAADEHPGGEQSSKDLDLRTAPSG